MREKRTKPAKTWLTETEFLHANEVAAADHRSLSDYLALLVRRDLYGQHRRLNAEGEWANSTVEGRRDPDRAD